MDSIAELTSRFAAPGTVTWIGVRPARKAPMIALPAVSALANGLDGDHGKQGKRAVTLIQAEHLPVIAAFMKFDAVDPALVRRNLVVSGINLLGMKDRTFKVGQAVFRGTGPCAPCSRMEQALGGGGYTAMRGHGGITAEVFTEGPISVGDAVVPVSADPAY